VIIPSAPILMALCMSFFVLTVQSCTCIPSKCHFCTVPFETSIWYGWHPQRSSALPAETGGGIHAVTGATVTSRAITDAVRESIELFLAAKKDGGR